MPKRIIVVDDHDIVRQGVRRILLHRPEWEIVGEAENGFEAVEKTKSLAPDLLILDISMPGKGGLEVMGELSSLGIRPKVLVLTMHDSRELSAVVRKSGAAGYVSKSHAARDLLRALGEIFEGGTFFPMEDAGSSKPASSAIT